MPQTISNHKLVFREAWSEGIETVNPGTDEQDNITFEYKKAMKEQYHEKKPFDLSQRF